MGLHKRTKIELIQLFKDTLDNLWAYTSSIETKLIDLVGIVKKQSEDIFVWRQECRRISARVFDLEAAPSRQKPDDAVLGPAFVATRHEVMTQRTDISFLKKDMEEIKPLVDRMVAFLDRQQDLAGKRSWCGAMYSLCHPDERTFIALPV